jgi:hypothetical protein
MTQLPMELNEVDRRVWTEELDQFVPSRVFDVHTHCYRWEFNTDPARETGLFAELVGRDFPEAGRAELDACDAVLLPKRRVHRLSFGFPFQPAGDFEASNRFVAEQTGRDAGSGALMLVHPSMSPGYLEEQIRAHGFLGFKPYLFYAASGDAVECRIADFFPERQIEVAHRHGLIVMLHLAKRDAIMDAENLDDLLHLTSKYGNAKWILAHCARSYSAWVIERAVRQLRGLTNVWYDTSSVCDADAIESLMAGVGPERVMYGSDDLPVGVTRGKYISFGYAWGLLSERNHSLDLSHCRSQMTFVRYEQLRAMRRAAQRLGLSRAQVEDLFFNTAARLVESARDGSRAGPRAPHLPDSSRTCQGRQPTPPEGRVGEPLVVHLG